MRKIRSRSFSSITDERLIFRCMTYDSDDELDTFFTMISLLIAIERDEGKKIHIFLSKEYRDIRYKLIHLYEIIQDIENRSEIAKKHFLEHGPKPEIYTLSSSDTIIINESKILLNQRMRNIQRDPLSVYFLTTSDFHENPELRNIIRLANATNASITLCSNKLPSGRLLWKGTKIEHYMAIDFNEFKISSEHARKAT